MEPERTVKKEGGTRLNLTKRKIGTYLKNHRHVKVITNCYRIVVKQNTFENLFIYKVVFDPPIISDNKQKIIKVFKSA